MKRKILTVLLAVVAVLLVAAAVLIWSGALAASEQPLDVGTLVQLELSGTAAQYTFTPGANGLYGVYIFPGEDNTRGEAAILLDGEPLVRGDGTPYEIFYAMVDGNRILYPLTVVFLFLLYISAFYAVYFYVQRAKSKHRVRA